MRENANEGFHFFPSLLRPFDSTLRLRIRHYPVNHKNQSNPETKTPNHIFTRLRQQAILFLALSRQNATPIEHNLTNVSTPLPPALIPLLILEHRLLSTHSPFLHQLPEFIIRDELVSPHVSVQLDILPRRPGRCGALFYVRREALHRLFPSGRASAASGRCSGLGIVVVVVEGAVAVGADGGRWRLFGLEVGSVVAEPGGLARVGEETAQEAEGAGVGYDLRRGLEDSIVVGVTLER
jgi:hypothetical protein